MPREASSSSISDGGPLELDIGQLLDATIGRLIGGDRWVACSGGGTGHAEMINSPAINHNFDKDFTIMQADQERDLSPSNEPRRRGGEPYLRPYMVQRFGLDLTNKYSNLGWLGTNTQNNNRLRSVDEEWPVAYHGTTKESAESILTEGLRVEESVRQAWGPGIYSTPDPNTALVYATKYKHTDGNYYKLFFQAPVNPNPERRTIVESAKHKRPGHADYWLMADNDSIRTYGLCIFKC